MYNHRKEMLLKLIRVVGIPEIKYKSKEDKTEKLDIEKIDPDNTYVLTIDNLMKMLAIHTKFRYL